MILYKYSSTLSGVIFLYYFTISGGVFFYIFLDIFWRSFLLSILYSWTLSGGGLLSIFHSWTISGGDIFISLGDFWRRYSILYFISYSLVIFLDNFWRRYPGCQTFPNSVSSVYRHPQITTCQIIQMMPTWGKNSFVNVEKKLP